MIKIIVKKVIDLTPDEYRACYAANYRDWGYMQQVLSEYRHRLNGGIAILLWDDTKTGLSRLIGWTLLTPVTTEGILAATQYTKRRSKYTAQFWVKTQYRKMGYGKLLMSEVKKLDPRPHVLPHDEKSAEFFSLYNVSVTQDNRSLMKRKAKIA